MIKKENNFKIIKNGDERTEKCTKCGSADIVEYEEKIVVYKNKKIIDAITINGAGGHKCQSCGHYEGDYDLSNKY